MSMFNHTLLYALTPWSRVLLEKLTSLQLVKKFLAFYGTGRLITASTSARHLSLSWANSIQSPQPTSWRSISILSSHLRLGLPSRHFPSGFPTKTMYTPLLSSYGLHALPISLYMIIGTIIYIKNIWEKYLYWHCWTPVVLIFTVSPCILIH